MNEISCPYASRLEIGEGIDLWKGKGSFPDPCGSNFDLKIRFRNSWTLWFRNWTLKLLNIQEFLDVQELLNCPPDIVLLYSSYILVGFFLEFCEKYIYLLVLYCLHSISGNKLNCLKLQFNHNGSIKTSLQKLETHLDTQTQIYTPRFYLVTGPWPKAVVSLTITKWLRYTHNVIFFNIERYLEYTGFTGKI